MNPSDGHEVVIGVVYTETPYPWRAHTLQQPLDPNLYAALLSQAVGDFSHWRVRPEGAVWGPAAESTVRWSWLYASRRLGSWARMSQKVHLPSATRGAMKSA
jgi:hypothetical protein